MLKRVILIWLLFSPYLFPSAFSHGNVLSHLQSSSQVRSSGQLQPEVRSWLTFSSFLIYYTLFFLTDPSKLLLKNFSFRLQIKMQVLFLIFSVTTCVLLFKASFELGFSLALPQIFTSLHGNLQSC